MWNPVSPTFLHGNSDVDRFILSYIRFIEIWRVQIVLRGRSSLLPAFGSSPKVGQVFSHVEGGGLGVRCWAVVSCFESKTCQDIQDSACNLKDYFWGVLFWADFAQVNVGINMDRPIDHVSLANARWGVMEPFAGTFRVGWLLSPLSAQPSSTPHICSLSLRKPPGRNEQSAQ